MGKVELNPPDEDHETHCKSFACQITAGLTKDGEFSRHKVRGWDTNVHAIKNRRPGDPTHFATGNTSLLVNSRSGDMNILRIRQLLEDGCDPNYFDRNGSTCLIAACSSQKEQIKTVSTLLEFGADSDLGRETKPIIEAAARGHCKIVQTLLDHGADINAQKAGDIKKEREAANIKSVRSFKKSLKAADDEEIRQLEKESAWEKFRTCAMDKKMPLEVLDTALHRACGNGDKIRGGPERIVALLLHNKADLHKEDRFDCTPLAWVTSEAVAGMLIFGGAELEETWALPLSTEGTFGHRVERVRIEAKYRHKHITKSQYRDMMDKWRRENKPKYKEWWHLIEKED